MTGLQPYIQIGIDISDYKLRLIALRRYYRRLSLHAFGEVDVPAGTIDHGAIQKPEILIEHLKQLPKHVQGGHIQQHTVNISLPEQHTFLSTIKVANLEPAALEAAATQNIPFNVNEMYFDIEPIRDHHTVAIAAGKKDFIDNYITLLKKAHLEPVGLYVEATAIAQALMAFAPNKENGHIIIDIGLARTTVIFYLLSSVYFTTSYPPVIANNQIDTAKLSAVIQQITYYYQAHFAGEAALELIHLCGSGAYLPEITTTIQEYSGIETILGDPMLGIKPNRISKKLGTPLSYTTAIGLALMK